MGPWADRLTAPPPPARGRSHGDCVRRPTIQSVPFRCNATLSWRGGSSSSCGLRQAESLTSRQRSMPPQRPHLYARGAAAERRRWRWRCVLGHGTARASRRERDGQPHRRDVARSVSLLVRRAERALWSGLRKKCAFTRAFGLNWHAQTFRVRASLPNPDTTVPCPAGLEEPWRAFRFAGPAAS